MAKYPNLKERKIVSELMNNPAYKVHRIDSDLRMSWNLARNSFIDADFRIKSTPFDVRGDDGEALGGGGGGVVFLGGGREARLRGPPPQPPPAAATVRELGGGGGPSIAIGATAAASECTFANDGNLSVLPAAPRRRHSLRGARRMHRRKTNDRLQLLLLTMQRFRVRRRRCPCRRWIAALLTGQRRRHCTAPFRPLRSVPFREIVFLDWETNLGGESDSAEEEEEVEEHEGPPARSNSIGLSARRRERERGVTD